MSAWLQQWVIGGGLIDTIIAITFLEVTILLAYHYRTKRGLKPYDYLLNVASGLCLMFALRCSLASCSWHIIAAFLLAAGVAHTADITLRLRKTQNNS